jgi:hypothetical protein
MLTSGGDEITESVGDDAALETAALAEPAQVATMRTAADAAIATACRMLTDRLFIRGSLRVAV